MSDLLLCRICAKTQRQNLRKIFDKKYKQLLEQITKLTGIDLQYGTNLPQFICQKCYKDLKKAFEFRLRLLSAQYYFTTTQYLEKLEVTRKNYNENNKTTKNIKTQVEIEVDFQQVVSSTFEENEQAISDNDEPNEEDEMIWHVNSKNSDKIEDESENKSTDATEKDNVQRLICDICGKLLKGRKILMKHMQLHSKRFKCEFCDYKCYAQKGLDIHKRKHTGERPFSCQICDKRFSNQKIMKGHMRLHDNVRPHACSYCNKSFATNFNLKTHLISHTGISRFNCHECRKVFQCRALLLKHYKSNGHLQIVENQGLTVADDTDEFDKNIEYIYTKKV